MDETTRTTMSAPLTTDPGPSKNYAKQAAFPLHALLEALRASSASEREKGTYFEDLILSYLRNEPVYRDLFSRVWRWAEWGPEHGFSAKDDGIDLVAEERGTGVIHAIQCKFYASDYRLQKKDIDSFFTASGRKPFAKRLIVSTTDLWSELAEKALENQQIPVSRITLHDLENSQIDWTQYRTQKSVVLKPKKKLRPHQQTALETTVAGLKEADRGKLIMACGTGKTFTSLKIAEKQVGKGGRVLFLVPSLALLSQSLTEWSHESEIPLHCLAVCSDSDVGKKSTGKNDDAIQMLVHELPYPATTNSKRLAENIKKRHDGEHMTVVFSTYHSIEVINKAQHDYGLEDFDLIICDEAHRTTGATYEGDDESAFVRVHDAAYIKSAKRLYMTATPRIYGNNAKAVAERDSVALYSMDDKSLYGEELHVITFSEAVSRDLLVDYKVIVLAVEESHINRKLQSLLADENNQLRVDDAAKIVGCWKALAKIGLQEGGTEETSEPMKRAVAFCQVIEPSVGKKTHKVSSKSIAEMFQAVVEAYQDAEGIEDEARLTCEAEHVDGGMNAGEKDSKLNWLKEPAQDGVCRILSNVRCLSEGVDVPALDAVLFLTPRNSQVDVVQSVGRVMRKANGKQRGYVVLPVVIPAGVEPHEALNDNKTYAVVWQVLQALRSHDDRFDAMVNKMELVGPDRSKMEVIAVTDKVQKKSRTAACKVANAKGSHRLGEPVPKSDVTPYQQEFSYEFGDIERALYAKIVEKCGNRHHWDEWASDIARIAQTHIDRITALLEGDGHAEAKRAFNAFAAELRDDLNDQVTDDQVVEMLAQHLITKPVFEALFSGHSFASQNPMSLAMQKVLDVLEEQNLDKEASTLQKFYDSVKLRAEGIDNAAGKQKIVVELYEKFFSKAFPKMRDRLGIVYTPVEVVDFILHSVNHLLEREFGQTLGGEGVHIIDPFTGTGTFITRLLQSGLIKPEELERKYRQELHANEIVLLAYYIAAVNIEATYHDLKGGEYTPFEGICLTDTFQMYEHEDLVDALLVDNSQRRKKQRSLDIRVIVGNPPYSVGQRSQNDNNNNVSYKWLDNRIRETYADRSEATLSKGVYDSYIRAIRWASDRIGDRGVIGFVTNAGFLDSSTADGLRRCLVEDFSSLYVFHLRGNQRTSGEASKKEGGKIFGSGSRAPIAISLMIKNPEAENHGRVYFHDIGDYLTREQKLERISSYGSVSGITDWKLLTLDSHGDWLRHRNGDFNKFIPMGDKKGGAQRIFDGFTLGVVTNRDAWVYNSSSANLGFNVRRMIEFYNCEASKFAAEYGDLPVRQREGVVGDVIDSDPKKISWTRSLKHALLRGKVFEYDENCCVHGLYRPFFKQWMYFNRQLNEMVCQVPRVFPFSQVMNKGIHVSGVGARSFSVLMVDAVPCLDSIEKGQFFPEFLYDDMPKVLESREQRAESREQRAESREGRPEGRRVGEESGDLSESKWRQGLLGDDDRLCSGSAHDWRHSVLPNVPVRDGGERKMSESQQLSLLQPAPEEEVCQSSNSCERKDPPSGKRLVRREAITDEGLAHFQAAYPGESISKQDLFFYIYGILHSPEYRERYADNLSKELPRIPRVRKAEDFWAFSKAGRELADLHLNYESVDKYPVKIEGKGSLSDEDYRVEKMRFAKVKNPETGKSENDRSTVVYNSKITISGIPEEAWNYEVNGKAALDWVMERQAVRTDKASGIVNDANDWARETMGNPRYPLELFQRVITVSLETQRIVASLPSLEILDEG